MGFDYSDGRRVEELILGLLEEAPDLSAMARIGWQEQDRHWPVRYHLAPDRANLLRHLDFSDLDVLELGAGMGGVSRFIAEHCRHLTVVEGSSRRFRALAKRLSDLTNWHGWFGRLEHFDAPRTFDVICLVGVFEYAERFIVPPPDFEGDAFDYLLQRLQKFLRPGGVLLLAIENRLGLKYWSGVAEDHSGELFDGIVGYADDPIARTFSRQELMGRLQRMGWHCQREYFPFPDYKLPTTVIDGELAAVDPELTADLACFHVFNDAMRPRSLLFSDYLAMQQLTRAGLFEEFANSFFWALSPDPQSETFRRMTASHVSATDREVAWHAAPSRRRPVLTRFFLSADRRVDVEKVSMDAPPVMEDSWSAHWPPPFGDVTLRWRGAPRQTVQVGERLRHRILRALYFRQGRRVVAVLRDYLAWARRQFGVEDSAADEYRLRGEALDALISNAVATSSPLRDEAPSTAAPDDARYRLFDQEWSLDTEIPFAWFILRNVACLLPDVSMAHPDLGFDDLASLYVTLCEAFDETADLHRDVGREATFQGTVAGRPASQLETAILDAFEHPFSLVQPPREADFAATWDKHLQYLLNVKAHLEAGQESLQTALSWQQECVRVEESRRRQQEEVAAWLQSNLEQSQKAEQWLTGKLEETRESHDHTVGAYRELEAEYRKLLAETEKLQGYAQGLEAERATLTEQFHGAQQELSFTRHRIEELYGCLEDLTQLLNGRAHRWVEMGRRTFWNVVGRWRGTADASPGRSE